MITADQLRNAISYDPETGKFTWVNSSRSGWNGKEAGSLHHHGYFSIKILGKSYDAHRLAWLYCHGVWPSEIDHKNGVRNDNRLDNLREVTRSENRQNLHRAHRNNASGILGITWMKANRKWMAQIRVSGVQHYLGLFATADEASAAYLSAKRKFHPCGEIAK